MVTESISRQTQFGPVKNGKQKTGASFSVQAVFVYYSSKAYRGEIEHFCWQSPVDRRAASPYTQHCFSWVSNIHPVY